MLVTGLIVMIRRDSTLLGYLSKLSDNPELLAIVSILLLLLPIPAIALFHHFFLSRFISIIPGERQSNSDSLFPGLISWWQSLYGWMVFVLSTLIATLFCTPLLPLFKLNYKTIIDTYTLPHNDIQLIFALIWLVSAALLYQIEYLVKLRLVFGDFATDTQEGKNHTVSDANAKGSPDVADSTQTQTTDKPSSKKKLNIFDWVKQQKNLPKKAFTITLIPLVALWLYQFAKLPEVRQTMSTNVPVAVQKPSPLTFQSEVTQPKLPQVTPQPTIEVLPKQPDLPVQKDTFEQAVRKGKRAVKLTKTAQTQDDWKMVESKWKEAIELLESVPPSSPNYSLAQEKIVKYRIRLEFAKHNATRNAVHAESNIKEGNHSKQQN